MKVFIIDFSMENQLIEFVPSNYTVATEEKDGGNAYKSVGVLIPDIILANYSSKPGHVYQTIESIKARKKTANIPLYIVTNGEDVPKKFSSLGIIINIKSLPNIFKKEDRA